MLAAAISAICDLGKWFNDMSPEVKASLIQSVATMLAAAVGFGAIVIQMRRQGKQARDALLEAEARKFKAELYREGVQCARKMADGAIGLSTALRLMMVGVSVAANA